MPLLPLGSNSKHPTTGNATVSELKGEPDPLSEFDEYGTELHREARVWKVYVKETDKYDGDLVKGWNDSADVILVFAALFSAISSAFIIESSKMLQQDPLLVISQTLLVIANGTQAPGSISTSGGDSTDFTPTRIAICINTLWYLSLSLSLATSFVAILAKDWCHSFMKDRTGHPFDQTCRRQRKWDMIVRWKMSELLAFLPSLIHVALLLFAIGLCIMLWDTHVIVAIPVICVAGIAFAFYISSSIAASLVDSFPYPTIISRIYRTELRQLLWQLLCELLFIVGFIAGWTVLVSAWFLFLTIFLPFMILNKALRKWKRHTSAPEQQSHLRALLLLLKPLSFLTETIDKLGEWIVENMLETFFVKMLSRPGRRIPKVRQGLEKVFAWLKGGIKLGNYNGTDEAHRENNVSSQALSWLITSCEVPQSVDIALQAIAGATNRISRLPLLECKAPLQILRRLASSNLYRDQDIKSDAVVSLYVRALSFLGTSADSNPDNARRQGSELEASIWDLQTETEERVAALIEEGNFEPTQSNLHALRIGSTVASNILKILQSEHGGSDTVPILDSIAELLKSRWNPDTKLHDAALLSLTHAAVLYLLVAPASIAKRQNNVDLPVELLTLCRNLPTLFGEQDDVDAHPLLWQIVILAIEHDSGLIASLATTCILLYNSHEDNTRPGGSTWFEEVIRELIQRYTQDEAVLKRIYKVAPPGISAPEDTCDLTGYFSQLSNNFMTNNQISNMVTRLGSDANRGLEDAIVAAELHALLGVCRLTSAAALSPAIYVLVVEVMCRTPSSSPLFACGAQILSKCPFPTLSEGLVTALEQRDLVSLLKTTRTSGNHPKWHFARGQLWLLLSLYIYAGDTTSGRDKLKLQLDKCRSNGGESEVDRHRGLGREVCYVSPADPAFRDLGIWAYRLDECISQFLPGFFYYSNELANVPPELRGLSSFTAWPRRADNSSTNEPRPVERTADGAGDRADATNVMSEGEGAAGHGGHLQGAGLVADTGEAGTAGEDDAGRADSSQDLEAATQGPPVGDGKSLAEANRKEEAGGVRGEGSSGVEAVGDERRVADESDAKEATDGPQSEGEETESDDVAHGGGNEGHRVIDMGGLENGSNRPTSSR